MGAKVKGAMPASGGASASAGDERRRAPRVLVDLEVDYASEDNYLFAYITDISATGIFIRTTTPEEPGTHLNLRFNGMDEALEIEGQVIWVNPYRPGTPDNLHPGMGIRFVGLDDSLRHRLLELIRRFAYLS
ncbi:MAG TPA: PilZ domain-containing protein [Kofleriaceae bacterium]